MAYRLTVSDRAAREIGEAYEWYQEQSPGLGNEFLDALDVQFQSIIGSPQLYAQTQRGIRRALLPRFPYGVFYAAKREVISVLAVVRTSRSPRRWPRLS
jgi:toxin ParE1/3/4